MDINRKDSMKISKQPMFRDWLIVLLQITLSIAKSFDSTHCLVLTNHPGTCLHFLSEEVSFDEAKEACWDSRHAVPFVPINDIDHHELLIKFYFNAKNNKENNGNIGLGISVSHGFYLLDHFQFIEEHAIRQNFELWDRLIFHNNIKSYEEYIESRLPTPLEYPILMPSDAISEGYLRINGKTGKMEIVKYSEKSFFACHSPRYPKFQCQKGWHTDYVSRTCVYAHDFNKQILRGFASEYCKKNGGNLASIHNKREYDIFYSFIKKPNLTAAEQEAQTAYKEYWFGLRHQNDLKGYHGGGLGHSEDPGFDERYKKVAYFVDGSSYTGFHHFHKCEPSNREDQDHFNGHSLTNNGWYRNWDSKAGDWKVMGVLCQCVVDISG